MNNILVVFSKDEQTRILYTNLTYQTSNLSVEDYMNELCLANGTTLEGCYKASYCLLGRSYKRPVCIDSNIFFPTHNPSNKQCIWINLNYQNFCTLEQISFLIENNLDSRKLKKQIYEATRLKSLISSKIKKECNL